MIPHWSLFWSFLAYIRDTWWTCLACLQSCSTTVDSSMVIRHYLYFFEC